MRHYLVRICLGVCCVLAAAAQAWSFGQQGPIQVSADSLEADQAAGSLVFIGHAVASQGDLTLYADRLTVFYAEQNRDIERVVAEGQVRIVQPLREATGDKAVFDRLEQHIILTGRPTVRQEGSFVQGEQIDLYLEEQRSVVTGGAGGRVHAEFQPQTEANP